MIRVQFAVPCTSTERVDDGSTDVELDPEAAILAEEQILQRGLHLVGWYHTHPKFKAEPSVTDISNHHAQQNMFDHPFVGLIVSTFDAGAVKVRASHRWFHTMNHKNVVVPMMLEPTIRAVDPRHAELTSPSQYCDPISKRVEKHLMEDSVDRWKPDKPTSPRGLFAQRNGGGAEPMSSQSSVDPLRLDGESLEHSGTEVGEPTSAASSHTMVSDGATEAQAVAGGSQQTVDAADASARRTKRQKQEKQPAKNARKKEPRSQKGDKPR
jgi:proteasome lid subunit RPN8/RPN11